MLPSFSCSRRTVIRVRFARSRRPNNRASFGDGGGNSVVRRRVTRYDHGVTEESQPAEKSARKPSGPPPGRPSLSPSQRIARDSLIFQRAAEGWRQGEIAREAGIDTRQVRNILKKGMDGGDVRLLRKDPVEIVEWALTEYLNSYQGYTAHAAEAVGQEYISAMKARDAVMERITRLLQATGKLPRELGTLRHIVDLRAIGERVLIAMDDFEAGEISASKVREVFEEVAGIGRPQLPAGEKEAA